MVMGVDSCSKGCGFESHHHTLDGNFFTFFFYNCIWTSIITFRFYETEICLLRLFVYLLHLFVIKIVVFV